MGCGFSEVDFDYPAKPTLEAPMVLLLATGSFTIGAGWMGWGLARIDSIDKPSTRRALVLGGAWVGIGGAATVGALQAAGARIPDVAPFQVSLTSMVALQCLIAAAIVLFTCERPDELSPLEVMLYGLTGLRPEGATRAATSHAAATADTVVQTAPPHLRRRAARRRAEARARAQGSQHGGRVRTAEPALGLPAASDLGPPTEPSVGGPPAVCLVPDLPPQGPQAPVGCVVPPAPDPVEA